MVGYSVKIVNSSKDLSAKERIQYKDTSDCVRIDKATSEAPLILDVDSWVELATHNEKAEGKDYSQYVVIAKDGTRYVTGSETFWNTFMNIYDEIQDIEADGETWKLKIFRMPSKNRQGKDFITCAIV